MKMTIKIMQRSLLNRLFIGAGLFIGACLAAQAESIKVAASTPYEEGHDIRNNIINECVNLGTKLATFTQKYSDKKGMQIDLVESVDTSAAGKVLKLEISDAVSQGNAFVGHRKFVEIKGSLWEDGKKIASFDGQRSSGGGFGAGYKSSCSVLGRCVKTLGKDISAWLQNPQNGVSIGE